MVIVKQKSENSVIFVPKFFSTTSALTFTLKSRLTNDEFSFFVEDLSGLTDYFNVEIDTRNLSDGEYQYEMLDNGNEDAIVSRGLLRIGLYEAEHDQYNYNQEYVQYDPFAEVPDAQEYTKK